MALEAGLLNRTRPRAFPSGASTRSRFTATRRADPDERDAHSVVGLCSYGFAGGSRLGGPGAADGAVLRVRAVVVSGARVDPNRPASRRLQDLSAAGAWVRVVDPDAPWSHGWGVSGAHGLRDAPNAARRARPPGSRHLPVRRRPPPVTCVPPARGGPPSSLPPVPGVCRRDPDRARHADRHASRVSRRAAPAGAALGHGSGAPPDDRPLKPDGTPRPHDLPPHGHLRPARVRGRDAHTRRRGVAGGTATHSATEDTRLALAAAHRRGRDRAA